MSIAVFNINDAGIQLTVDNELVRTSPGIAVLNNNSLLTGEEASKNVKLLPRWTNNRFWSQLNTNPLPNSTEQVRHHADIEKRIKDLGYRFIAMDMGGFRSGSLNEGLQPEQIQIVNIHSPH